MACGNCGREPSHGVSMIGMQPGHDGQAWELCSICWRQGAPAPVASYQLGQRSDMHRARPRTTESKDQPLPSSQTRRRSTSRQ